MISSSALPSAFFATGSGAGFGALKGMVGSGPLWSAAWSTGGVLASGVLAGNSATCATLAPACNASPSKPQRYSRSEEHTSELQSLMRISYAVFCLKKKNNTRTQHMMYYLELI